MQNELEQRVAALGLEHHVRMLGYVADADLPLAYRAADLNVVPARALEGSADRNPIDCLEDEEAIDRRISHGGLSK